MNRQLIYMAMELWGAILCMLAAFIAFCTGVLWHRGRGAKYLMALELVHALMLFADSAAWAYRGNIIEENSLLILKASNFLSFFFSGINIAVLTCYILGALNMRPLRSRAFYAVCLLVACFIILLVATQYYPVYYYFDKFNYYHRSDWFWLSQALVYAALCVDLMLLLRYRRKLLRKRFLTLMAALMLPLAAVVIQTFVYGWSLSNIAITIGFILIFIESLYSQVLLIVRQEQTISAQKELLRDMQVTISLSQIKPHFLYNALNSVYVLCGMDVERGREALSTLSDYLRTNIDSIDARHAVPFDHELRHIRNYLALECLRYGDRLACEYDIQARDFTLPVLTVQPLVENAVRHGISRRERGGTVRVRSRREGGNFVVSVEDDGVGFDVRSFRTEGHAGISNVRERLAIISRGRLEIRSSPDCGTTATVIIPGI